MIFVVLQRTVSPVNRMPVTTPRKNSVVKSLPSNVKESLASEEIHGMDQKSDQPFLSIIDQLCKSHQELMRLSLPLTKWEHMLKNL